MREKSLKWCPQRRCHSKVGLYHGTHLWLSLPGPGRAPAPLRCCVGAPTASRTRPGYTHHWEWPETHQITDVHTTENGLKHITSQLYTPLRMAWNTSHHRCTHHWEWPETHHITAVHTTENGLQHITSQMYTPLRMAWNTSHHSCTHHWEWPETHHITDVHTTENGLKHITSQLYTPLRMAWNTSHHRCTHHWEWPATYHITDVHTTENGMHQHITSHHRCTDLRSSVAYRYRKSIWIINYR